MGEYAIDRCAYCSNALTFEDKRPRKFCSSRCREAAKYDALKADPERYAAYLAGIRNRYVPKEPKPKPPPRFCGEENCTRLHAGRGMCKMHYRRWARANGMEPNAPWDDKARDKYHRRRARMNGANNADRALLSDIIERDGTECRGCHTPVDLALRYPHPMSRSVDHAVPISKGGKHDMSNTQLMHLRCNLSKGARLVSERDDAA